MFDNSVDAADGRVPDPVRVRVLHVDGGRVRFPTRHDELAETPTWAMATVEAATTIGRAPSEKQPSDG